MTLDDRAAGMLAAALLDTRDRILRDMLRRRPPTVDFSRPTAVFGAAFLAAFGMEARAAARLTLGRAADPQAPIRVALTPDKLRNLRRRTGTHAVNVLQGIARSVQARIAKAVEAAAAQGLTTSAAVQLVSKAFDAAGITPASAGQIETIVRTHMRLARSAARRAIEATPEYREVLWGYRYETAADERVRPSHIAMQGVTLPADDPFWKKNYPPNGWNCRCTAIAVYERQPIVRPPAFFELDGERIKPGADPGFDFDPVIFVS